MKKNQEDSKHINPANAAKDQALAALPPVVALYIINQFASNQMIVPCQFLMN